MDPAQITVGGATIEITFSPGSLDLGRDAAIKWITIAAQNATKYYGRFPVPRTRIQVRPTAGREGVFRGTTWGNTPPFTRISVGERTTQADLNSDWMMTHELLHTAFPDLPDEHHWLEEGIATYVESVCRVQNQQETPEKIWSSFIRDMPQGLPAAGDRGLDFTPTWGRTYWGGAIFCVMADVRIRQATHNAKGLQDALRAVLDAGGSIEHNWPVERALQVGDKATGATVLIDLYNQMKGDPVKPDLDKLWADLGIERSAETVVFHDKAPLSAVRRAITQPR